MLPLRPFRLILAEDCTLLQTSEHHSKHPHEERRSLPYPSISTVSCRLQASQSPVFVSDPTKARIGHPNVNAPEMIRLIPSIYQNHLLTSFHEQWRLVQERTIEIDHHLDRSGWHEQEFLETATWKVRMSSWREEFFSKKPGTNLGTRAG